jgi:hypothetical protein
VQTQIASFDEFVQNTIQELVDESPTLTLSSNAGAAGRDEDENSEDARRHEINVLLSLSLVEEEPDNSLVKFICRGRR